uniref:Uncharacterized protein n=1 Tax=Meloidogyne enterolobii TaxID=390850 RepID=A0A6V7WKW7_MELEN|nr:unnamed protein product [Meloidogyne enterolobii]
MNYNQKQILMKRMRIVMKQILSNLNKELHRGGLSAFGIQDIDMLRTEIFIGGVQSWTARQLQKQRRKIANMQAHAQAHANNALESSHYHFVKKLNHHPSMSDFLLAILDDVDKQVDIARSATTFTQQRKRKYVIKEFQVMHTLNEAEYDDNRQLLNVLTLLGLQMSGYVEGLRVATRQQEERDTEDGVDSATLESQIISQDHLDTSSSLFIY